MRSKIKDIYIRSCVSDELKPMFDIIGETNFRKVMARCGGSQYHFPSMKTYHKYGRDFEICRKYANGDFTIKELAKNYGISASEVRRIISKVEKTLNECGFDKSVLLDEDLDKKFFDFIDEYSF